MMKLFRTATICFIALLTLVPLQAMSEKEVLRQINLLLTQPNLKKGQDAGERILKYAGAAPNHVVRLEVDYMPWVKRTDLPAGSELLLAAFVAGNLREQIRKGTSSPEPYAGVQAALKVYRQLVEADPSFRIQQVDNFLAMERRGALQAHIVAVR